MLPIRGTINNTLAWHLLQILLFPQKNIKATSPIFETRQRSRLPCFHQHPLPLSSFCLFHSRRERYFCSYKSFSVCWCWSWRSFLWMDLVSQRKSLRVVTSILLILASPRLPFISVKYICFVINLDLIFGKWNAHPCQEEMVHSTCHHYVLLFLRARCCEIKRSIYIKARFLSGQSL